MLKLRLITWIAVVVLAFGSAFATEVGLTSVVFPDGKSIDVPISGTQRAPAAQISAKVKHQNGQSTIDIAYKNLPPAVLFGGDIGFTVLEADTWTYDGVDWVEKFPLTNPSPRSRAPMTFASSRGSVVLFGGRVAIGAASDETWEWDGVNWNPAGVTMPPSARANAALCSDSQRGVIVLYGGELAAGLSDETWEGR